jgi:hypothetical protein
VGLLRIHLAAVAVVVAALAGTAAVFAFARPAHYRHVEPAPPDHGLPYTHAVYTAADAERAFAEADIALILRSKLPLGTDLSDRASVVEVTVFADTRKVAATGVYDYTTDARGHYVRFPTSCANGARVTERWRGNVRAIVVCDGGIASLRRVERALASLPARSARDPG